MIFNFLQILIVLLQTVRHLCYVCHRLLMHSPTAMHNYALLFTLAFRQWFLHTLWNVVTSSVQTSLLSSHPTPLIQVPELPYNQ